MAGDVNGFAYSTTSQSKYESKSEKLGTQNIEGVEAEGTRTVTTIALETLKEEGTVRAAVNSTKPEEG